MNNVVTMLNKSLNTIFKPVLTINSVKKPTLIIPKINTNLKYLAESGVGNCKNIAFIVPYRNGSSDNEKITINRELQLTKFIDHIREFFENGNKMFNTNVNYNIFVLTQDDDNILSSIPETIRSKIIIDKESIDVRKFNRGSIN